MENLREFTYDTELPFNGLSLTARLDYNFVDESVNGSTASVSLFGASTSLPATQPDYEISSFVRHGEFRKRLTAWLGVDNLFDERAITFIAPRFSDNRAFTIRPREITLGIFYEFLIPFQIRDCAEAVPWRKISPSELSAMTMTNAKVSQKSATSF